MARKKLTEAEKREYQKLYMREYRRKHPAREKNTQLKKDFGIDLQTYDGMLAEQDGRCAICGKKEEQKRWDGKGKKNLAVDHCHTTGKVRGLLCSKCNTGLGSFKEDPKIFLAALNYLNKHKGK